MNELSRSEYAMLKTSGENSNVNVMYLNAKSLCFQNMDTMPIETLAGVLACKGGCHEKMLWMITDYG